ncbi:L-lactate dehydrogenase [Kocuria rhizophila]|uniref:L-lactate dehydrogenase n=1 Tax=Kocuria rhizophila TaxID=72000 RepID=UPI00057D52AC|nr:L-lactate dehydrogenase [Kocuria rhizophila]KIC70523.1 lactate dehydrogenase [Kocuria rhizophila]
MSPSNETTVRRTKIGIVGAGSVGTSLAYAAMIRGTSTDIALYDLQTAKVQAEALDLSHGQMFAPGVRVEGSDDVAVLKDADIVFVTAGAKQKPGQTRLDLAGANTAILKSLMPQLLEQAPQAVFVLVTNPCDVLTVVAQQITGLPYQRIMSSGTVLDTSRLRWLIGNEAQVNTSSVHAYIIGEHGDSEFPVWSSASIGQVPVSEWEVDGRRPFTPERLVELKDQVVNAAYRVIEGKGATNYAIGLAGVRIAEAVLKDQQSVLSVSTVLDDYYGVSGVALSVPSVVGGTGVGQRLRIPMGEPEKEQLRASAETMRASLRDLGF